LVLPSMFLDFLPPLPRTARPLVLGIVLGISLTISSSAVVQYFQQRRRRIALSQSQISELESRPIELRSDEVLNGVIGLIGAALCSSANAGSYGLPGNTPLVRIPSLSDALGVEILAKAEAGQPLRSSVSLLSSCGIVSQPRRKRERPRRRA
jgi:cysteine synthase A